MDMKKKYLRPTDIDVSWHNEWAYFSHISSETSAVFWRRKMKRDEKKDAVSLHTQFADIILYNIQCNKFYIFNAYYEIKLKSLQK